MCETVCDDASQWNRGVTIAVGLVTTQRSGGRLPAVYPAARCRAVVETIAVLPLANNNAGLVHASPGVP
jgi:hypothetical protein